MENLKNNNAMRINTNCLYVSDDEIRALQERAIGIIRSDRKNTIVYYASKVCPTRHGCKGATECDYCMGDYPY